MDKIMNAPRKPDSKNSPDIKKQQRQTQDVSSKQQQATQPEKSALVKSNERSFIQSSKRNQQIET
jgi:hypothetical protein